MSDAVPDATDPVAKIGDMAASAGVRRIHVLAWRDLEDVEAGGPRSTSRKLWATAGLDVTMRTSWAQGQPTETVRDGYKVIRRAGRHLVFPRRHGRGPRPHRSATCWSRSGTACRSSARSGTAAPGSSPHHVHAEMWNMTLGDTLGPIGALFEAKVAPPSTAARRSPPCPSRRSTSSSTSWASATTGSRSSTPASTRASRRVASAAPTPWWSPSAAWPPSSATTCSSRRPPRPPAGPGPAPGHRGRRVREAGIEAVIDELDAGDWVTPAAT